MHKLWAPWRMEYIEKVDKEEGCFLCDSLKEEDNRKNLVLYRGDEAFIMMNKYPYNCGHLMIASNEHTPNLLDLPSSCRDELMMLCGKSMDILKQSMESQGFNCGMNFGRVAGAGVEDHFHLHVVPRWSGDTNFFPILADTKSLPEYLEKTYDRIIEGFEKI